jgi:hypothetical protein
VESLEFVEDEEDMNESEMESYFDQLQEEDLADEEFFEDFGNRCHDLEGVRCAAHTLQLAVLDALKTKPYCELIQKVRTVSKTLKTQTIQMVLDRLNQKHAILDCPTR